jgi:hypothetical protein
MRIVDDASASTVVVDRVSPLEKNYNRSLEFKIYPSLFLINANNNNQQIENVQQIEDVQQT